MRVRLRRCRISFSSIRCCCCMCVTVSILHPYNSLCAKIRRTAHREGVDPPEIAYARTHDDAMQYAARVLVLVCLMPRAADALRLHASLTRAEALKSAMAVTLTLSPLAARALDDEDDDDLNSDDEVPMVGSTTGRKQRAKPAAMAPVKADADAGRAAFQSIVAAREALKRGDQNAPEVKDLSNSLATLVQSPLLSASDKKTIGSPRTYGLGADVVIMVGGGDVKKAVQALDEIVVVCKSSGLKP